MTEALLYQSRVKSSAGNYGFSTFKVGDRIVIQLENLSDPYGGLCLRWQYLDNATGEITGINGNKAFVLLDELKDTVEIELCLLTQISSQDSEFSVSLLENLESQQTYAASGTNSVKESCEKTSPVSPFVETSLISTFQTITEPSILLPEEYHVRPLATKEDSWQEQTIATDSQTSCELLQDVDQGGYVSKTSPDCLTHPLHQDNHQDLFSDGYCNRFPKSGTWGNGLWLEQPALGYPTIEKDCLSLPTPTALSSLNSRPPGQNKLEVKLKQLEMIQRGEVANPEFLEAMFGLPRGYSSPVEFQKEIVLPVVEDKPSEILLPLSARSQPLEESSTSTHSASEEFTPHTGELQDSYSSGANSEFKAISLWQPWASLIPLGLKHYETRSWKTNYRGKLLICSTAANSKQHKEYLKICDELQLPPWSNFPHGQAITICDLTDCIPMTTEFIEQQSPTEILCGDWQVGRYAWKLENIQPITEPFAVKGKQGLFNVSLEKLEFYLERENPRLLIPDPQLLTDNSQSLTNNQSQKSKSSDCWYTPLYIIELILRVLGAIDLDPCADDGKHIPAAMHFTVDDDGLSREWEGRIFMNPPYSCPGKWMKKLQAEYESGRLKEAIALVPVATDTKWLNPVLRTQVVCFWTGRIKFLDTSYQPRLSARQAHCLVYWGENWQRFKEVFDEYGGVQIPLALISKELLGDKKNNPLYLISPSKRQRGSGNGSIHWRTITKNGKDYPQAFYHWKENGKKRTKYIPQHLLGAIQQAEQEKHPVIEILKLLGVESSGHKLLGDKKVDKLESVENTRFVDSPSNSPSNDISPSKMRRDKGEGSGTIHWRTITKNGKDYPQAYYHYEFWSDGDRLTKSSRYIPKRRLSQVQRLEADKAPVREILQVLGVVL